MHFFSRLSVVFLATLLCFGGVFAVSFPEKPTGFVTDTTSTLSADEIIALDAKLKNYEQETGSEIAVALIPSTEGMNIAQYATELGNTWGVGKKGADNGVLLVIAKDDHELFIAVGRQMEGALTDIQSKDIIDSVITPRFKEGNFSGGIDAGIDGMMATIKGESFTDLRMTSGSGNSDIDWWQVGAFFFFFGFSWLAAILGRSKEVWPGAIIGIIGGGLIAYFSTFDLIGTGVIVIFMGIFGLVFDWIVSSNYQQAKKSGSSASWWAGGGSGGSSSGGSFGGFSGGSFGGGGAGGRW